MGGGLWRVGLVVYQEAFFLHTREITSPAGAGVRQIDDAPLAGRGHATTTTHAVLLLAVLSHAERPNPTKPSDD